jgi:four helix bundle protein
MDLAEDFTELDVYREARSVAKEIYELSKAFPRREYYELVAQLRRASRSIGAQIAEAWGKRRYPRHFVAKLTDADAEQRETRHWIGLAVDCGYLEEQRASELDERLTRIGKMLVSMMKKAPLFRVNRASTSGPI